MALVQASQQNVQQQRNLVMVPDDPRARLMYYINCIGRLLDLQGTSPLVDRLQMYNAYIDIAGPTLSALLNLAIILRPENLFGGCLIVNDDICDKANASFLIMERNAISQALSVAAEGVKVQGATRKVFKIMVVKKVWLVVNFYGPFVVLAEVLKAQYPEGSGGKSESCACAIL